MYRILEGGIAPRIRKRKAKITSNPHGDFMDPEKNPWKTLSTREIYKDARVLFRADSVIRPDGTKGVYTVLDIPASVAIVPIDTNGKVTLVKEWRYPIKSYSWGIPMGYIDSGEKTLGGARRELMEESGITARSWTNLGRVAQQVARLNNYCCIYLAQDLTVGPLIRRADEVQERKNIPIRKAIEWCNKGTIVCAISVSGLFKAAFYLGYLSQQPKLKK